MDAFMPTVNDQRLLTIVDYFISSARNQCCAVEGVVCLLYSNYKHFTWVGFYFLDNGVLKLGPYRGDPSPHVNIPVGKGICGAVVQENKTIIVPDVCSDSRYLDCSITTRSEIVVPIKKDGHTIAEINIDSDTPGAFTERDQYVLELIAEKLSKLF